MGSSDKIDPVTPINNESTKIDYLDQLITGLQLEYKDYSYISDINLNSTNFGKQISELSHEENKKIVFKIIDNLQKNAQEKYSINNSIRVSYGLLKCLLKRKLPLIDQDFLYLLNWLGTFKNLSSDKLPTGVTVTLLLNYLKSHTPSEELYKSATTFSVLLRERNSYGTELIQMASKLESAFDVAPKNTIVPGGIWSDQAIIDCQGMDKAINLSWLNLIRHGSQITGSKPTEKWEKVAKTLLIKLGQENFITFFIKWMPLVDKGKEGDDYSLCDPNIDIIKGLVWYCKFIENDQINRVLTSLAFSTYKKIPGSGPRAMKIGNACINVIGQINGLNAIGQLAILKVRIKFKPAQKLIETALTIAAERENIPRDEIEEMSIPAYGLEEVGIRREKFGDFAAELLITEGNTVELRWFNTEGKQLKSVPKELKDNFSEDLIEIKGAVNDIQKMLPAQKGRIENLFLNLNEWDFDKWKERYLDHPLVGTLGRRIIWIFKTAQSEQSGIFFNGKIVNYIDEQIKLEQTTKVMLWHPVGKPLDDILGWREWLHKHSISQPFKQAHREVYLLTEAEKNTSTYSNRFAAHILKQHQFNALCGTRGWKNQLRLMVDDNCEPAHINLPKWNLRAEFWIEGVGTNFGADTTSAGTYNYLSTDQVRFYRIDATKNYAHASGGGYSRYRNENPTDQPLNLESIPPLVLSEILRDVDLFVGVSSVGNDPAWADGGSEGRYYDYWNRYSFGELGATAEIRKSVLEKLIPKLKIANKCTFDKKFLIVKGEVRTYKIHLGSGNILMEPNDQYLCIVANQSGKGGDKVMLPFEGDRTLSIILSKAFLLAEDKKIKDQTIISQINKKY